MIKLHSVCFSYPEKEVLRDFSMHVDAGERVRLTGLSGAGKTTLLRLILGLETPQSGEITVNAKRVSVLFQEDRLLPFYTVLENLTLFSPPEKAIELLNALQIPDAAGLYPSELSGGMARRVALARALSLEADLYLFDEPFTGLDEENRLNAIEVIGRYTKGKTLVFVSHGDEALQGLNLREIAL